jgi:Tfp pilus assembly protein PilO
LKLPNPKATTHTLLILAGSALLLFILGVFIYVGCSKQLVSVEKDLAEKQRLVDDSKKIAARLIESQQQLQQAQLELGCLETSVATYQYVPTLLKQLEQLGKSNNLRVLSVRPKPAPPAPPPPIKKTSEDPQAAPELSSKNGDSGKSTETVKPYEELSIDVEVEGTYWNTRNFVNHLTKFPKIISVKSIQIIPSGIVTSSRQSPKLSVIFNVTAYIFPLNSTPATYNNPKPLTSSSSAAGATRRAGNEG